MNTEQQRVILRFLEDAGLIDRAASVIDLRGIDLAGGAGLPLGLALGMGPWLLRQLSLRRILAIPWAASSTAPRSASTSNGFSMKGTPSVAQTASAAW